MTFDWCRSVKWIIYLVSFFSYLPVNSQKTCVRIGDSAADLDSAVKNGMSIRKFADHEVWEKNSCYLVVVDGKITSYDNRRSCFEVCEKAELEKNKQSIENWILKTLSNHGTGPQSFDFDKMNFQRYWFNEHYLVMYYAKGTYWEERVMIPVAAFSSITSYGSQYTIYVKKKSGILQTNITTKRESKIEHFDLLLDDKGEEKLSNKLINAFKDLRKFYKDPPVRKDLY